MIKISKQSNVTFDHSAILPSRPAEGVAEDILKAKPLRKEMNDDIRDFSTSNKASRARGGNRSAAVATTILSIVTPCTSRDCKIFLQFVYGSENWFLPNCTTSHRRLFGKNSSHLNLCGKQTPARKVKTIRLLCSRLLRERVSCKRVLT